MPAATAPSSYDDDTRTYAQSPHPSDRPIPISFLSHPEEEANGLERKWKWYAPKKRRRRLFVRIQQKKDWMSSCSEFRILKLFCRHLLEVLPRFRRHIAEENCPVCPSVFLSSRREKKILCRQRGRKGKGKRKTTFSSLLLWSDQQDSWFNCPESISIQIEFLFLSLILLLWEMVEARTEVFRTFGICATTCTKKDQKPVTIPCNKAKLSRNLKLLFRFSIEVE